jgi:hypothetical protein
MNNKRFVLISTNGGVQNVADLTDIAALAWRVLTCSNFGVSRMKTK